MANDKLYHVTNWRICYILLAILFYLVDIGLDVNLAVTYYNNGLYTCVILTLASIVIPALFSYTVYLMKDSNWKSVNNYVPFPYVTRNARTLLCALRSRYAEKRGSIYQQIKYCNIVKYGNPQVVVYQLFESYVESGLQQILQISLLVVYSSQGSDIYLVQQCLSIGSSFITMAIAMVSYYRYQGKGPENLTHSPRTKKLVCFLWHFNVTVSRILSIALIASRFPIWTGLAVTIHWFVMSAWKYKQIDIFEFGFFRRMVTSFCCGFILIFNYVEDTIFYYKYRKHIFYTISFLENLAAVAAWALLADTGMDASCYYVPLTAAPIVAFLLGMIFFATYEIFYSLPVKLQPLCDYHIQHRLDEITRGFSPLPLHFYLSQQDALEIWGYSPQTLFI